jgi:sterol 14-demethylase
MQVQTIVQKALRRSAPPPAGLKPPPRVSGGLPLVGHTVDFVRSTIALLMRAQREHGEVAALEVAGKSMVGMFGPEAHAAVFRAPDKQLNPKEAYRIMTPVFGENMVYDAPDDRMNEQLKMLLPALKDKRMRTYGETILAEVEESIAGWGDEGEIDLVDYCRVLTNFTSSHCLIGKEFRDGMTEEFARVYHDLERGVTPLAYINAHLPLPSFRRRDRARVRMVEMISEIVEQRARSERQGEDFLQTLIDAKYKSGAKLTHDEITGMLLASMFAGHHTSSVTTAWTLLELMQNPSYRRRLVGQLDEVYTGDAPITYQSLRDITLTEYAVKEALRLHPPLFMLVRVVMEDFDYKGYHLPAGTWLLISPTVAHRMAGVFRDPLAFDPDRYAPPREEDKLDYAYIPFGGGRHKCMGNAFALLQVKAILAVLLRHYEFELSGDPIGEDFHGLVVGPTEPCRLRYRRREGTHTRGAKPRGTQPSGTQPRANGNGASHTATEVAGARPFRVTIDSDLCQGHAVCIEETPELFAIGDDGKVKLLQTEPPAALYASASLAAKYCPTRTIQVIAEEPE